MAKALELMRRIAEMLHKPLGLEKLIADGVLRKKGDWYEILDFGRVPKRVRRNFKATRGSKKEPSFVMFSRL